MNQPATVLLVERDEQDFRFLHTALRRNGAARRVQWAHDADDACAYLAGVDGYADRAIFPQPDVILVDLRKPGVGELEFVRWMRTQADVAGIPVVALTAGHNPRDWECARELGVNAFHLRPADPARLAELVDSIVRFWAARRTESAAVARSHAA